MASRKIFRIYRWKLFFPMLGMMWLVIMALAYVQFQTIVDISTTRAARQMRSAMADILNYYERNETPRSYFTFLSEFIAGTHLEQMRLSVYDRERLCFSRGPSIPLSMISTANQRADASQLYVVQRSNNGEIACIACIPRQTIARSDVASKPFWLTVIALMLLCTVISYLTSSILTRNIEMLSKFASRAASGEVNFDESRFSHDELGDISRQIVRLYNDKTRALARTTREHEMAMFAVEEKSRIKRQLTNNINHEIKTPVGVIRGYLDTIMNSPEMDESTRMQFLTRAHRNVVRLCDLLNDVSTMTRLEESGANVQTTEIDFHELVFGVETDLSASGVLGTFEFESDIPLGCMVRGNSNLLTGTITNLIRNAAQHSHGTKIGIKLIVESDKFYTFAFYDNGVGVEEEHLPHLFERFYRVDAGRSRKAGGTGLGLPIVKGAIETLGGSISVHNRSTGGLEFLFTLEKWNTSSQSKRKA